MAGGHDSRTRELAFYRCYSPRPVPLAILVKVAGIRWTTEENFQAGKGLAGLDEHQVRRWDSWYRWTTLAMLALAFLSITAATGSPLHRSSCAAFSWLCSLFLVGFLFLFWRCPTGTGVVAGRACPALA